MPNYKLIYFDVDGGRGEPLRIALHAAGIDFEDHRLTFPEFAEKKSSFPFNAVPVMEIDGSAVTQTNALCRYIGKMAGLYPEDPVQALYCDEVLGTIEDMTHRIVRTFGLEGEELRLAREALVNDWLGVYLKGLEDLLNRGGGEYFADQQLTIADLKVLVQLRAFAAGTLDHVPTDIVNSAAPKLAEYVARIEAHPVVQAYYAGRS